MTAALENKSEHKSSQTFFQNKTLQSNSSKM